MCSKLGIPHHWAQFLVILDENEIAGRGVKRESERRGKTGGREIGERKGENVARR